MRTMRATLATLMLMLLFAAPALADGGNGSTDVVITVDCDSNPETVTIENRLEDLPISIIEIGSLVDAREDEPFFVGEDLPAGGSVTFESGSEADENVLTTEFIFDDDAEGEGVAVRIGPEPILQTLQVTCDEGSRGFDVTGAPSMPDTGAGAVAGDLPIGNAAAALSLLAAAGYATLRRR